MNITHKDNYEEFLYVWGLSKPDEYTERQKRLIFLTDRVLDLTTYCDDYSLKIGEQVLDIVKFVAFQPNIINYRRDGDEFTYILYVQFIKKYLDWGTNIYFSWFDSDKEILGYRLTPENVSYLISWFDCTEEL